MEKFTGINTFYVRKTTLSSTFFIRSRVYLHGGSLEIALTVPSMVDGREGLDTHSTKPSGGLKLFHGKL